MSKWSVTSGNADIFGSLYLQTRKYEPSDGGIGLPRTIRRFILCSDINDNYDYFTSNLKQPMLGVQINAENNR